MTQQPSDGGPAFPRQHAVVDANDPAFKLGDKGMSLRDYFAAKSMLATIAKCALVRNATTAERQAEQITEEDLAKRFAAIANSAYGMADAMLKAREEEK